MGARDTGPHDERIISPLPPGHHALRSRSNRPTRVKTLDLQASGRVCPRGL